MIYSTSRLTCIQIDIYIYISIQIHIYIYIYMVQRRPTPPVDGSWSPSPPVDVELWCGALLVSDASSSGCGAVVWGSACF